MPPHFSKFMNRGEEEKSVAEKIRLLMLLKKVRDENMLLKVKLNERGKKKKKQDDSDYEEPDIG
jgi:hypothetical protein